MVKEIHLVKAFTQDRAQGNPAGVVLDADDLTAEQMLRIAAELGFSESAFISHSNVATFKVRFFSPKREVPICGHATIAAFHTLFTEGKIPLGTSNVHHLLCLGSDSQSGTCILILCPVDRVIVYRILHRALPSFLGSS